MAHDVFISYSSKNATVADAVCGGLERRGIPCWIAPRDVQPGQEWAAAIIEAIDACNVFVIIVSADSNRSEHVLRELNHAASAGKPILPFRIEDIVLSSSMRYYLDTRQWLDALSEPLDEHIGRLANVVGKLLGREGAAVARQEFAEEPESVAPTAKEAKTTVVVEAQPPPRKAPAEAPPATPVPDRDGVGIPQPVPGDAPWERPGSSAGDEIVGPDGGVYVWVPPGSFMMGSDDGSDSEKPVHRVQLDGFWLGKHQVTNAQYRAFCDATGRAFPAKSDQGDDHPVVWVNYHDAQAYCEHHALGLPTEAQWEYAARGPENRVYPWGDEWAPENLCWLRKKGPGGKTFPVGSFPAGASWCGALDMAGNVWEWCADWYSATYYQFSPELNPRGPESGAARVSRGGSWYYLSDDCRGADRADSGPSCSVSHCGFRCAIAVPAGSAAADEDRPQGEEPTPAQRVSVQVATPATPVPDRDGVGIPQPVPGDAPWERPGSSAGDEIVGPDGGVYVWVPPGSFMMGSDDGSDSEKPVHRVQLDGFWLGKHQVTNAQYRAFCDATGRAFPAKSDQGDDHPVVWVNYHDAQAYCEHHALGLPTEAQWEYAARGLENRVYPWGDEWAPENLCWSKNKGPGGETFPVGSFPAGASWCGALDMAGNVWDWCEDWFARDYYQVSPELNPRGPESGTARVVRGGSWNYVNPGDLRAAYRGGNYPSYRVVYYGFRCSRGLKGV